MTEISQVNHHAELQLGSATFAPPPPPLSANGYSPAPDGPNDQEEFSEIRCFCGFSDDDGSTVFCERCNTWQHVQCFYPSGKVPEVHECDRCKPRTLDAKSASERQRMLRLSSVNGDRRPKRPPGKSHKKKPKDVNQLAVQTNGWTVPDHAHSVERNIESPRDHQPPPAKRPKTSHRSTSSTSALIYPSLPAHSRKRAGSVIAGQSPTKSPPPPHNDYNGDYYSPEFMRLQRQPDFAPVQNNSYASIAVSNDLRTWLNDVDSLVEVTNGLTQHRVFHRWDGPIEDLEQSTPGVTKHAEVDASVKIQGEHPIMQWLTADAAASREAYIGELKGHIGKIEDYYREPNNRWDELNHPEPFVFFHDKLPLYIDCREEGTKLRYLRRSCQPNVKMQIIIRGTDFHFCMVSMRDIAEGEELTVPWHIRGRELEIVKAVGTGSNLSRDDQAHMSRWFTRVLANFGGCACARMGSACALDRFDLRSKFQPSATNGTTPKLLKGRKSKKGLSQISPLSTGRATNSRAGSEALKVPLHLTDLDEDLVDDRSISNLSHSKPSSRDNTPLGHTSDEPIGLGVELSDRERRKILQQEKLFEKMEQDGGGRKKRNSAGSALNTPSLSNSVRTHCSLSRDDGLANKNFKKQLGFPDAQNPSSTFLISPSKPQVNGERSQPSHGALNGTLSVPRSKPIYAEATTQTEEEKEEAPTALTLLRRAQGSYAHRLLRRVHEESRKKKERSVGDASRESTPVSKPVCTKVEPVASPEAMAMPPPPLPSYPPHEGTRPILETASSAVPADPKDVDMKDGEEEPQKSSTSTPTLNKHENGTTSPSGLQTNTSRHSPHPPIPLPAPPWPIDSPTRPMEVPIPARPVGLRVQLPPVPTFSALPKTPIPIPPSVTVSPRSPGTSSVHKESPPRLTIKPPLFSPSVASAVAPSPVKKKLTLSDYTKRKNLNTALAQAQAQQHSSPNATAMNSSSPIDEKSMEPPSLRTPTSSAMDDLFDEVEKPVSNSDADRDVANVERASTTVSVEIISPAVEIMPAIVPVT